MDLLLDDNLLDLLMDDLLLNIFLDDLLLNLLLENLFLDLLLSSFLLGSGLLAVRVLKSHSQTNHTEFLPCIPTSPLFNDCLAAPCAVE